MTSIARRSARRPIGACSRRSGPSGNPTGSRCSPRPATARSPRSTPTRTGWCARCARAACRPATGSRCCARTGPSSSRPSSRSRRAGPAAHDDQLASHRRRGRLHRRRLRRDRVRRRRALRRRGAPAPPSSRRGCARASRSAATIAGFDDWDDALAAESGDADRRPVVGSTMLYTSGTTGRPKGVRRPPDPRGALDVGAAHAVRPRRARAPLHRSAVPRRAARVLAGPRPPRWACRS